MALTPRKKTQTTKKESSKQSQGATSVKKTSAKSAAATSKRVPVIKRSAPVLSKKQAVIPVPEAVILPPKVEARVYQEMPRELPDNYGDNQIYLLVRDPYWIYSYWEIQEDHQRHHLAKLGGSWESVVSVLRVYDTTEEGKAPSFSDIVLQNLLMFWSTMSETEGDFPSTVVS